MRKYFEFVLEGLSYGGLNKNLGENYKEAVKTYSELQKKYNHIECTAVLYRVTIEGGIVKRKLEYKNHLGKENQIKANLNKINDILSLLIETKDRYAEEARDNNDYFNDLRHAIELGAISAYSEKECKNIFDNMADKSINRRWAKGQGHLYNMCSQDLNTIYKAIQNCTLRLDKHMKNTQSDLAKKNREIADNKYIQNVKMFV